MDDDHRRNVSANAIGVQNTVLVGSIDQHEMSTGFRSNPDELRYSV
jgi:hypothetical protein